MSMPEGAEVPVIGLTPADPPAKVSGAPIVAGDPPKLAGEPPKLAVEAGAEYAGPVPPPKLAAEGCGACGANGLGL